MTRLKKLRERKGICSQRELAHEINAWAGEDTSKQVSYASIARMEAGTANPRWNIVRALSKFFDVSPNYLMGETDDRKAV